MRLTFVTFVLICLAAPGATRLAAQEAPPVVPADDVEPAPVEPDVEPAVEPAPVEPVAEPAVEPVPEPAAEPATEPATEPAAAPDPPELAAEPGVEPTPAPVDAPAVEPEEPADDAQEQDWFAEYRALAKVYGAMNDDYVSSLQGYMRDEIQARIQASQATRDEMVMKLSEVEARRRKAAMDAVTAFIKRYDRYKDDPQYREHIADALFRLAEMHREHAEYEMDLDAKLYDQRMREYEWGIRPSQPREADADYGPSLRLYSRVVNEFPDYRYRDMAMYLMGYYHRLSEKLVESTRVLRRMVADYPESKFAMGSWMLIGHNSYDVSNYKLALEAYSTVASRKENNEYYEDALYRLGWASFEEFKYVDAIGAFLSLLDHGEETKGQKRQRSLLRKEAIESIANSFVDEDWDGDDLPDFEDPQQFTLRAMKYITRGRPYEKEILRKYADLLFDLQDAKHWTQAVIAYAEYLKQNPMDPENPLIHDRMVYSYYELSQNAAIAPPARMRYAELAMEERRRMAALYGKGSKWAEMHRYDAKALKLAASKLGTNLLERAQLLHQMAQERKEETSSEEAAPLYLRAASAYEDYLEQFPESANYVEMLRRLADIQMFGLHDNAKSAILFARIREMDRKDNPYREEAAELAIEARANLVVEAAERNDPAVPIPEKLFDTSVGTTIASIELVDKKDPTAKKKVNAVEIPPVVMAWMADAQKFIDMNFEGKENHEKNGMLAYLMGKIYLRYGHFDEARTRLNAVLQAYGTHPLLSVYCYTDIARTYRYENDLDNLETVSQRMMSEGKGDPESVGDILEGIKDARLKARFQRAGGLLDQAKQAKEEGKIKEARELYSKAANELELIVDENPNFDKADVSLLEAARAYEEVQLYDKAATLYRRLVEEDRFKKSDYREMAVLNLAENYEKFFNFTGAVTTYRRLVREYSKGDNVKRALLKIAELLENDQRYVEAAEAVQEFLSAYPRDERAGKLLYLTTNLYEKGSDKSNSEKVLKRFLKKHGRDKDFAVKSMTAQLKLGRMAEEKGKKKDAQKRFKEVVKLYDSNGLQPGTRAASLCAEANFRLAESKFSEYERITITGKSRQQRTRMKQKLDKLKELQNIYGTINNYDAYAWTVAAYFKAGALWKDLSDSLANAPYPSDLPQTEEAQYQYQIQMGDAKARFEDKARSIWREGIEIAKKTGVFNDWTYKILVELNKYEEDRLRYPLFREIKQLVSDEPIFHFPSGQ